MLGEKPLHAATAATEFVWSWNLLAKRIEETATTHGFRTVEQFDDDPSSPRYGSYMRERSFPEALALMHSELSEALEAYRAGGDIASDHIVGFLAIEEELADCVIRIMDTASYAGWRVAEAIVAKAKYNESRPHKHGGKRL